VNELSEVVGPLQNCSGKGVNALQNEKLTVSVDGPQVSTHGDFCPETRHTLLVSIEPSAPGKLFDCFKSSDTKKNSWSYSELYLRHKSKFLEIHEGFDYC
jgi:hypothetical protein